MPHQDFLYEQHVHSRSSCLLILNNIIQELLGPGSWMRMPAVITVCMYAMYVCMQCMYVCMYVYMYVCMSCVYVFRVCIYVLSVCMYVCMHACIHMCVCMHVCVCMYVCVYIRMYIGMLIFDNLYACMYVCISCMCVHSFQNLASNAWFRGRIRRVLDRRIGEKVEVDPWPSQSSHGSR
jgi:hypothetical protein